MKQILLTLLVSLSLIAPAQGKNKKVQRIKHAQLIEMTMLAELTGDLPTGVNVRYEMMGQN